MAQPAEKIELFDVNSDEELARYEAALHEAERIVEAMLFAATEPLDETDLSRRIDESVALDDVLERLREHYAARGVNLTRVGKKWFFRTAADLSWILAREQVEEKKLSRAALETLAVVAYHQPERGENISRIQPVVRALERPQLLEIGKGPLLVRRCTEQQLGRNLIERVIGQAAGTAAAEHVEDLRRTPVGVAMRGRDFWLIAGSFFVCGYTSNGLIGTHLISASHDHGIPEVTAASMLAFIGIFDLIGTTGSGWLTDRYDARRLLATYYGLRGLSLLLLPLAYESGTWGLGAVIVFYGLDWIATVPPTVRLTGDAFGREKAGIVFGWVVASHQVGGQDREGLGLAAPGHGGRMLPLRDDRRPARRGRQARPTCDGRVRRARSRTGPRARSPWRRCDPSCGVRGFPARNSDWPASPRPICGITTSRR